MKMSKRKIAPIWSISLFEQVDKLKCKCKECHEIIPTPNYGTMGAISHLQLKHKTTEFYKMYNEILNKNREDVAVAAKTQKMLTDYSMVRSSFCQK